MADYMRARSPERKKERMSDIMEAADKLFVEHPYHEVTMGAIAGELGRSRSNLYRYGATVEEVFLALHHEKNGKWIDELTFELSAAPMEHERFARIWAEVTERHSAFLRYQEILTSIIESNVTFERLVDFKRGFANMLPPITDILRRQCDIGEAEAVELYLRLLYQAPGLWSHFHCSATAREAMRAAGLSEARGSFVDAYADFTELCIAAATNKPDK